MNKNSILIGGAGVVIGLVAGFLAFSPEPEKPSMNITSTGHDMANMSAGNNSHAHGMIEIDPALPLPEVTMKVLEDEKGGYNIQIITKNFTLTPDKINQAPIANEGHAHLFVNGEKVTRLYGGWYYLSDDELLSGDNMVEVTLNANDHSDWGLNGQHISDMVKMTKSY